MGDPSLTLRAVLARSIRSRRGKALLEEKSDVSSLWADLTSQTFVGWIILANGWFLADRLGWSAGPAWIAGAGIVLVAALVVGALSPSAAAILLIVAFGVTATLQAVAGWSALVSTHGVSGVLAAAVLAVSRARGIGRHVPLLLPLIVLVLFVPLFTADLWDAADDLSTSAFAWLGLLTCAPLAAAVLFRLGQALPGSMRAAALRVAEYEDASDRVIKLLRQSGDDERTWTDEHLDELNTLLSNAFGRGFDQEQSTGIIRVVSPRLLYVVAWRLVTTAFGVGSFVTAYAYLLAWAAIPRETAVGFVGHAVPFAEVTLLGEVPGGVYVGVAILLGIAATAVFLAFALTEDRYAEALAANLVTEPFEELLLLAVPYQAAVKSASGSRLAPASHET